MSAALSARLAGLAVPPTDADLLARYAAGRDGAAFAELVRRHGPMVLAVCRRVTAHAHDAEDAFQAAFLVLARKAARLGPGDRVAAWLYGVAVRAARKARGRRGRETPVAAVPDVPERTAEPFDPDAAAAVIEEVGRLPDFLRAAVVLCELEGRSRAAAARELGVAEGTLSSRLAAARKRLAERLTARGFAPSVLAVLAPVAVPQALASTASALASGPAPVGVSALAHGVDRAMILHKLCAASVAVGLVAVAVLAASPVGPADVPRPAVAPPRVVAQPKPAAARPVGPGTIIVGQTGSYWRFDPDGKKLGEVTAPAGLKYPGAPSALSPDGTRLAAVAGKVGPRPAFQPGRPPTPAAFKLVVGPAAGGGEPKVIDIPAFFVELHWMPDGKSVLVSRVISTDLRTYEHLRVDPADGELRPLMLPDGCHVLDVARDGKTFLVDHRQKDGKGAKLALAETGVDGVNPLTDLDSFPGWVTARFSPDGKQVLFVDGDPSRKDAHKHGLSHRPYVLDLATGKREPLADFPENGRVWGVAWSPDGKRVAYTWELLHADLLAMDGFGYAGKELETFLMVADADGRNAKTLASDKSDYGGGSGRLRWIDWR